MAKNRDNIRIYGDDDSGVWLAAKGATAPTEEALIDRTDPAGFTEAGWLSEDGIDLDRDSDSNDFNAYQGGAIVRSKRSSTKDSFKFVCLEETAVSLGLYYAGQTPEDVTPGTVTDRKLSKYTVTNQTASDERAWVVRFTDGINAKYLVVPVGEVSDRATISHKNTDLTMYEFTVTIFGDYDLYTVAPVAA